MKKLTKYLKKYSFEVFAGQTFKLIEAILELIVPLIMAKIIDVGIKNSDVNYILKMGGLMLFMGILGLGNSLSCQYLAARASQGFGTDLRNIVFLKINSFSHKELDKFGTSSFLTRITNDINQLQLAVAMLIRLAVRAPFLIIGATVMAIILDLHLSVIFLFIIPLIVIVLYLVMSKSVPFYKIIQKKVDKLSLIIRENLNGIRVIRAFSKQKSEEEKFKNSADDIYVTSVKVGEISALLNPLTFLIMNFGIIAVIWFGGKRVELGFLTQGKIIAFVNYMTQILLTLIVFANLVVIFTKAVASATRINEILDETESLKEADEVYFAKEIPYPYIIEFKNVYFSYNHNEEYSLSDISFQVKKGETIGIIGGTGSGKSTLIGLIPRFYDTDKGKIFISGENIQNYKFKDLRDKIGFVPQKAVLFQGSLADNLRWGNINASNEELKKAVNIAQAEEFVEKLTNGYDTIIEQGGKNFSGGQKQRLTIARALVRKPEILILDDSSSALDFATDAKLRKSIKENKENMTVIIISQRANSIKYADKIIVLDDGKVVGQGTHDQLINTCEIYKEICLSQLKQVEAENE